MSIYFYFQSIMQLVAVIIWQKLFKKSWFLSTQIALLEIFRALCIWTPAFDMYNCSWRHLGRLFVFRHERLHPAQLFFLLYYFAYLIQHYNIIIISFTPKKGFLNSYSPDVYLSEFFKLSLVGLWLGEEDEWPKRYSCLESIVGFFGISVKN